VHPDINYNYFRPGGKSNALIRTVRRKEAAEFNFVMTIDDDTLIDPLMKLDRWATDCNRYRVFD
jgi:hypothetical protein